MTTTKVTSEDLTKTLGTFTALNKRREAQNEKAHAVNAQIAVKQAEVEQNKKHADSEFGSHDLEKLSGILLERHTKNDKSNVDLGVELDKQRDGIDAAVRALDAFNA